MLDLPDVSVKADAQHHRHGSEASSSAWAGLPDLRTASNGTTSSCTALSVHGDDKAHQHECNIKSASPPHAQAIPMFNAFGGAGVSSPNGPVVVPPASKIPDPSLEEHMEELVTELRALTLELRHSNMVQTQLLEALLGVSPRAASLRAASPRAASPRAASPRQQ